MDDFQGLLDALPTEQYYGPEIPAAKKDAATGILSLPTELLQVIAGYCSNRTMLSLMRVNLIFHRVALYKFYKNVHITCNRFSAALEKIDTHLSIEEILPLLFNKRYGVLSGLLQRQAHLDNLRLLHVIDFPLPLTPAYITYHKILRYLMERATTIQRIELPWSNGKRSLGFEGLAISSSLQSVLTPMIQTAIVTSILRTASLQSLEVTFQCADLDLLQELVAPMAPTLKYLQCMIHITSSNWEEEARKVDDLLVTFNRLETLKYGYCTCTDAVDPQPDLPVQGYVRVAKGLSNLTTIVVIDRRNIPQQDGVKEDECKIVASLSEANDRLQEIAVGYLYAMAHDRDEHVARWIKSSPIGSSLETSCVWTPSPRLRSRWSYWFDHFKKPALVNEEMSRRWKPIIGDEPLPSLWELEWWHEYHRT